MIGWIKKYSYISVLFLFACTGEQKNKVLPVGAFFANTHQFNYRISPNGEMLCFLRLADGKQNLFVRATTDSVAQQLTFLTDISVRSCAWAGNKTLLCIKEKDSLNRFSAFLIDVDGSNLRELKTKANTKVNVLDTRVHDNTVLITVNEENESLFDVYRLNLSTGEKSIYVKNPGNIFTWYANSAGEVNLALGGDGVNETLYYRERKKTDFKPLATNNYQNTLEPVCFSDDGHCIYALSNLKRDKLALVKLDCRTGEEKQLLYENPEADILEVMTSEKDKKPVALSYEIEKRTVKFLNAQTGDMFREINEQLPGREIQIIDKDSAEQRFIVRSFTDKNPGAFFVYHVADKKLDRLSAVNPRIDPAKMCEMQAITFESRDGLQLHGYLTLPNGSNNKKLPCVVLPHPGPSLRNVWGYSPEVQFLANRGYAVLQVNFRGSSGYGKAFLNAGSKEWSNRMQHDIYDGVQWLVQKGVVDPDRIGIFGYGFGGYSALCQVIQYPQTYKCAASYSGYINLFSYIKGFPAYVRPYKQMLTEIVGNPEKDIEYLKSASPVFQVGKIKTPLFIAQGGKDSRVNVTETNQFVKELQRKNVPVEYMLFENETQLFKDNEHKLEMYRRLSAFLEKYL